MNKCVHVGRLTADPDLTYLKDGTAMTKFTLAINERWGSKEEVKERVDFLDFVVFGKSAENCQKLARKGGRVVVESKARHNTWEDDDGEKHSRINFNVLAFEVIDFAAKTEAAPTTEEKPAKKPKTKKTTKKEKEEKEEPKPEPATAPWEDDDDDDSDIDF